MKQNEYMRNMYEESNAREAIKTKSERPQAFLHSLTYSFRPKNW